MGYRENKEMTIIILTEELDKRTRAKEQREFYEDRLEKLMFRYRMLSEEIRQTQELIDILKKEE